MTTRRIFRYGRLSDKALHLSLFVLAGISVVTAVLNGTQLVRIGATYQIPLVLLALLAIIQLLDPVEEIHSDVRYLRTQAPEVKVQRFQGPKDFYTVYNGAVRNASARLDLTHIRSDRLGRFGDEAEASARLVMEFVESGGSVRRIISVANEEMKDWARQLDKSARAHDNYHVCVVDWLVKVPPVNMAIVDANAVFLTVAGATPDRMNGVGIEDPVIGEYFSAYYEQLYASGTPLSDWLKANSQGA